MLHSLSGLLDHYGYAAIIVLVGVEGFGIPAPGQTTLLAAGVAAGTGHLNLALVLLCGVAAAVCGDNIGYAIGHFGGRPLVVRFGRHVGLTEERMAAAERFFDRHGNIVVPAARFVDGLRQFNGVVAGSAGMPWWRFLAFNFLGALAWVGIWVTVGYAAGDHIDAVFGVVDRYQKYVAAAVVVLALGLLAAWLIRRRRRGA